MLKTIKQEERMQCEILPTNKNHDQEKTLTYFTTLYTIRKLYSEDRAATSEFESGDNITHIASAMSVGHTYIKSNRGDAIGTESHDYVEGQEEPLLDAKEYTVLNSKFQTAQTMTSLCAEVVPPKKQTRQSNRLQA